MIMVTLPDKFFLFEKKKGCQLGLASAQKTLCNAVCDCTFTIYHVERPCSTHHEMLYNCRRNLRRWQNCNIEIELLIDFILLYDNYSLNKVLGKNVTVSWFETSMSIEAWGCRKGEGAKKGFSMQFCSLALFRSVPSHLTIWWLPSSFGATGCLTGCLCTDGILIHGCL